MNPTILAALFASSLALLGLTVGKDSKVSEFRQQWIDGLRADVAEFVASVQHVFGFRVLEKYRNVKTDPTPFSQALLRTNELSSRIRLRLDPSKPLSVKLSDEMARLRHIAHEGELLQAELIAQAQVVEDAASALLDEAWGRVKRGEATYRRCIWVSAFFLALSVLALIFKIVTAGRCA